jgi:hypothetical protein
MITNKIKTLAQTVGFACVGLLALYGALAAFSGGYQAQAAVSASQASAPASRPVLLAASTMDWGGATVPLVLNYQGNLTDGEGNPLSGYYTMTFKIYDAPASVISATTLYTETHISVTVRTGRFSVLLGNDEPIPETLFNAPDRFIGVTVHPYDEMVPRQRFASAPYAMHAADGVPAGAIIMWSGSLDDIPHGWALCDGTDGTPDLRDRFILGISAGEAPGAVGGSTEHNHTVYPHSHSIDPPNTPTESSGRHNHTMGGPSGTNSDVDNCSFDCSPAASTNHTHYIYYDGVHTHDVNIGAFSSESVTSDMDPATHLPPYFKLAFLIKLP